MSQAGDPDQVRKMLWFCVKQHLNDKIRPELRDTQRPHRTSAYIRGRDPQRLRGSKQAHHRLVIE